MLQNLKLLNKLYSITNNLIPNLQFKFMYNNKFLNHFALSLVLILLLIAPKGLLAQNKPVVGASLPVATPVAKPAAYSSAAKINYNRVWTARSPQQTALDSINDFTKVGVVTNYTDGLGRPLQTVVKQASLASNTNGNDVSNNIDAKDFVTVNTYDAFGREQYHYLPFVANSSGSNTSINDGEFKKNPFVQQESFNQNVFPNEQIFYTKTDFEATPFSRPIKAYAQGNSWGGSGKGVSTDYLIYTQADDDVKIWSIGFDPNNFDIGNATDNNIPFVTGTYNDGDLYKSIITNESGLSVITYVDKSGKVILKKEQTATNPSGIYAGWLCTYYVYDDFGNLRFVFPPKAVASLENDGWPNQISNIIVDELCFHYEFDDIGRLIATKTPGKGWEFIVYDNLDRPVFYQSANMRNNSEWKTILYDELNRSIITGMYRTTESRARLQYYLDDFGSRFEVSKITLQTDSRDENFEISNYPIPPNIGNFIPLTINYFDNYNFNERNSKIYTPPSNTQLDTGNNLFALPLPSTTKILEYQTKGLTTGSKVRIVSCMSSNQSELSLRECFVI